jgi:hypothetical protein
VSKRGWILDERIGMVAIFLVLKAFGVIAYLGRLTVPSV